MTPGASPRGFASTAKLQTMDNAITYFTAVAALAIVLQMLILLGMYLQVRQMNAHITRITTDVHERLEPILSRVHFLLEESHENFRRMVSDGAEMTHLARVQAQKVDRVFTEAVDRLRDQILRADQILTGVLEHVEDAGVHLRKTVLEPVQQATAFIRGIKSGIDFLRARRASPERAAQQQDEELFI